MRESSKVCKQCDRQRQMRHYNKSSDYCDDCCERIKLNKNVLAMCVSCLKHHEITRGEIIAKDWQCYNCVLNDKKAKAKLTTHHRNCLKCGRPFESKNKFIRICVGCKTNPNFRSYQ